MANTAVFGIYSTKAQVEIAVDEMKAEGFRNADISVLFPFNEGTKDFAIEKSTKAPEGVATGATTGGVIGGALGWLAGIGMLAIPGLGPFIAAGPIVAMLSGVGVGAAVGGLTGALIGLGIPEYEATRYEGRIKHGGILLSVHADDSQWISKAKTILKRTGADDIASSGETKGDYANSDKPKGPPERLIDAVGRPGDFIASEVSFFAQIRAKTALITFFFGRTKMSFGLYIAGYLIVIIGLIYGASLMHIATHWIVVGAVILAGLGILSGVTATRQKDSN